MILGIDVGYSHTKVTGEKVEFGFKSTIEEGALDIGSSLVLEYNDKIYTVGEDAGIYATDINKIETENFEICLYTAIAKAMGRKTTETIDLVTGLPAQYYQEQKDKLIKALEGKNVTVSLNGKPKRFTIQNVIVFPQSAGVLLLNPELLVGDTCIVDIGGFTVDLSIFNGKKLRKLYTIEEGMNVVANKLVQKIKSEYEVSYDILKADDLLDSKMIIKDNKQVNIESLIESVLAAHYKIIENRLKGIAEYNTSKRIFVGGGSKRLESFIDTDVAEDTVYTNSRAYYKIGVEKFER